MPLTGHETVFCIYLFTILLKKIPWGQYVLKERIYILQDQGCINMIKSDREDIYGDTKHFCFK